MTEKSVHCTFLFTALHGQCNDAKHGKQKKHGVLLVAMAVTTAALSGPKFTKTAFNSFRAYYSDHSFEGL